VGALVVNPGGPGFGASAFVDDIDASLGPEVLEVFDIIGFDRGVLG
jgi:hypothetical protein